MADGSLADRLKRIYLLVALAVLLAPGWAGNWLPSSSVPETSLSAASLASAVPSQAADGRPNILLIITDNQHFGSVEGFMPHTWSRIFQAGVTFTNGFVTTPNCCPSRSSILTGMYAHNHGVRVNQDPLTEPTFVVRLHEAGYFTGQVGKYLNSWDGSPRPEFDFWVSFPGGGTRYVDPPLIVDGVLRVRRGYLTHLLRDYALEFLQQASRRNQPFVLLFAPTAPHENLDPRTRQFSDPVPAPGHENLYPDLAPYRPPNYNEEDVSDKPRWLRRLSPLSSEEQDQLDAYRRKQLQTLKAADDAIGALLDQLERQGKIDNTLIVFLADNGEYWGEHRVNKHPLGPHDPASKVDFAVRYPLLVPGGQTEERLVANIDVAPTLYELAGLPIPPEVNGSSWVALLQGTDEWRDELLVEGWSGIGYAAVRTAEWFSIENDGDRAELYDLWNDPYLLENRAEDATLATVVDEMRERLQRLKES